MNARERFLEVALFGNPDKVPFDFDIRPATIKRWIKEGLPEGEDVLRYFSLSECSLRSVNITSYPWEGFKWEPSHNAVNLGPIPPFEYRILREDEKYRIWIDSLGITQMGFQEDWKYGWSGFATRVFIDFPVKTREDFLDMKKRYNPNDSKRYPKNWSEIVRYYKNRDYPLFANIPGLFWWARDMLGLKNLIVGIYRESELIREIIDFCTDFHIKTLHKALDDVDLDYITISEDIAYKRGPMINPKIAKELMGSNYKELIKFFRDHGVHIIFVDSDGNVEPLIPFWLDVGINGVTPCEVAAGIDVVELGKKYSQLVMMGGIDKRILSKDRDAIFQELDYKVPPLIKRRGYFPSVDHAVPPDVPLENFKYFILLLKKFCGWIS